MMSIHAAHASERLPKPESELSAAKSGSAVFAGGCFWCTEAAFRQLRGVKEVVSGYAGDTKANANYKTVCSGSTNHAEAIRITFDPAQISYGQLLQVFFTAHDPTTKDRQGNDRGKQYRSAIFYSGDEEKKVAESYISQLNKAKIFHAPIVTSLEALKEFFPAEEYHQNYVAINPDQPYVQQCSLPKVHKIQEAFADWLKK